MSFPNLLSAGRLGRIDLSNRIVMAPLTRSRADDVTDVPSPFAPAYYAQRVEAGLIITEATNISRMAKGYIQTPGIYNDDQVRAWAKVTDAIHEAGGRIVMQIWHVGRCSHPDLLPSNVSPVAPSPIAAANSMAFTATGPKPCAEPVALDLAGITETLADFARAAANAKLAGFDGVEIHGANGFLIDQFLRDRSNQRTDDYGGSTRNRVRFAVEVAEAFVNIWGSGRVGIRLSPFASYNDMRDSHPEETVATLIDELNPLGFAYLHMVEDFPFVNEALEDGARPAAERRAAFDRLRSQWKAGYIANGQFTPESAEKHVANGMATAVSFGRPFIANPDFVNRVRIDAPMVSPDPAVFYGGGEKGYSDFPVYSAS
ncbi:alkene reductase [Agrobacterium tumefaciens]|uniref:alkene reductase n=1 Tax=Agrobacterium tumefaciens TaxID=358 RepID=UPI0012B7D3BC|nr:alkene reductase [Agrobacterium tumefaciens]MQB07301.1 alkene reductase [Agrobacterium tumefaciens]